MDWPLGAETKPITVLDYVKDYPEDQAEFCGLYGYNLTYTPCKFLGNSNRYYLVMPEFKG